jgi:hypothetical protein
MKRPNEAARDLWAQLFERAASLPDAALHRSDEKEDARQAELVATALREAGWSGDEIKHRAKNSVLHENLDDPSSPRVGPGIERKLRVVSDRVRNVISETGETLHEGVEIGVDPKAGVTAALTNVVMTNESILSVSAFLFRWCGLIARAYTRTLLGSLYHWTSTSTTPAEDRLILLKDPDLILYWFRIFLSFSATGTNVLVPYRPSTPREFNLFEQVAWAMEYFTVAHEFGHHVLGHRDINQDATEQEFQADEFAARICERLEFEPFPELPNPYTRTGAGGSLMLLALNTLRSFEDSAGNGGSHPIVADRISRISNRNFLQPRQLVIDRDFNATVARIMEAVSDVIAEFRKGGDELVARLKSAIRSEGA